MHLSFFQKQLQLHDEKKVLWDLQFLFDELSCDYFLKENSIFLIFRRFFFVMWIMVLLVCRYSQHLMKKISIWLKTERLTIFSPLMWLQQLAHSAMGVPTPLYMFQNCFSLFFIFVITHSKLLSFQKNIKENHWLPNFSQLC